MAYFPSYKVAITLAILLLSLSSFSAHKQDPSNNCPPPPNPYSTSCPNILSIVKSIVQDAIKNESRMGASLLRLHFHDCFVQGCDASILLDDTSTFRGEKAAAPNLNSARGFEVIDTIKTELEKQCPGAVSCADILAIAARDSVVILGGPTWEVKMGRYDSLTASQGRANTSIPPPTSSLRALIKRFNDLGLDEKDLVALSGAHTIGQARCTNFRTRIYNESNINPDFARERKDKCPRTSGDNNLAPLDLATPIKFDNNYYKNLVDEDGLLHSDQELFDGGESTGSIVRKYENNEKSFRQDFAAAMVKMGNIGGSKGEIRKQCWKRN